MEFARDIYTGKWNAASKLVANSDQSVMKNLADGADPTTQTSVTGLKIGDVKFSGTHATAVLLGKTCHLKAGFKPQCIDNTNPSSTNPTFRLSFARQGDTWKVVFPKPSGSSTEESQTFSGP